VVLQANPAIIVARTLLKIMAPLLQAVTLQATLGPSVAPITPPATVAVQII
jgi:hypothetical protein